MIFMYVIKADGSKERFQPGKIFNTCMRAGTSKDVAEAIVKKIESKIKDGTTTHEIYKTILDELERRKDKSALSFPLREAIANLDPEKFEIYVKKILEEHGYECKWNNLIQGKCVEHQVDLIAKKEKLFLVECKHHINHHRFCGLGIALQVQARLEDIMDGFKDGKHKYNFDMAWIISNTKFSDHAKVYAKKKNIRLTGWRHETDYALEELAQSRKIYPVTLLKMDKNTLRELMHNNILTVHDLLATKKKISRRLIEQAKLLANSKL